MKVDRTCAESAGASSPVRGGRTRHESDYEEIFERARTRLDHRLQRLTEEQAGAARLYLRVMGRPPSRRRLLLRNLPADRTLCLAVLLVDEAHSRGFDDLASALEHATLAVRIASRLSRRHYGEPLVEEISARAWASVGTTHRRSGRLQGAHEAFRRARRHLSKGCGEPLEEGWVLEQEAALDATCDRWTEALRALARAGICFRQVRDRHLEGRVRIKQGVVEVLRRRLPAATEPLVSGLAGLEGERDPYAAALGHALLAALLSRDRALPIQARAREALRQARRWLDRPQAGPVRGLVARVETRILHGATIRGSGAAHRPIERLMPAWPRWL